MFHFFSDENIVDKKNVKHKKNNIVKNSTNSLKVIFPVAHLFVSLVINLFIRNSDRKKSSKTFLVPIPQIKKPLKDVVPEETDIFEGEANTNECIEYTAALWFDVRYDVTGISSRHHMAQL